MQAVVASGARPEADPVQGAVGIQPLGHGPLVAVQRLDGGGHASTEPFGQAHGLRGIQRRKDLPGGGIQGMPGRRPVRIAGRRGQDAPHGPLSPHAQPGLPHFQLRPPGGLGHIQAAIGQASSAGRAARRSCSVSVGNGTKYRTTPLANHMEKSSASGMPSHLCSQARPGLREAGATAGQNVARRVSCTVLGAPSSQVEPEPDTGYVRSARFRTDSMSRSAEECSYASEASATV